MSVVIESVGPAAAHHVLRVVRAAFSERPPLDPPTDALSETEESIADRLKQAGGLVAYLNDEPVGTVVLDPQGDDLYLRRFGVLPEAQGHGVARRLVETALEFAAERALDEVTVLARAELPATIGFWHSMGFVDVERRTPYLRLARPAPRRLTVPTAEDMRALGARVARNLRAGDVVVLSGELGAGKTTFTQGLGEGLGVRGAVTSPTFVIARVHPSLGEGPCLVHVDAYRLDGAPELDDLDLDADLDASVIVVEWGSGLAEALTESPLEIRIERAVAEGADVGPDLETGDVEGLAEDPRQVVVEPLGPGWLGRRPL